VLVVAMLITPGATAYLLTDRLPVMLSLSAIIGVLSAVIGMFYSVVYDVASGASIVLVASFFFGLAFFFSPKQGIITRKWRARNI